MDFFCVSSPLCKISILCCCNDTWVPFDRLDLTSSKWGNTFQEDRKTGPVFSCCWITLNSQHFSGGQESGPRFSCCCQITLNSLCLPLMHCNAMAHRETNTSRTNVYPITLQCNHCTHYTTSQWCKISFSEEDSIAASNMSFDAGASLRLISLFFLQTQKQTDCCCWTFNFQLVLDCSFYMDSVDLYFEFLLVLLL